MDKIARIRKKIKELRKLLEDHNYYLDNSEQALGYGLALDDIEKFLDTLEAEERPEPYIPVYDEEYLTEKQRLFKEHHGEVDVDKMLAECRGYDEEKEEPDKSLEEAAEEYEQARQDTDARSDNEIVRRAFIAGAEWQKSQMLEDVEFDSQVFGKVMSDILAVYKSPSNPEEEPFDYEWTIARQFYELGKKNMKEQMLKDAVEGKIYGYDDGSYELVASWLDLPKGGIYKDGDKVRIVVLKEEE